MRALVTGANGFVGKALCSELTCRGFNIIAIVRKYDASLANIASKLIIADLDNIQGEIQSALKQVDVVIHAAGRAHILKEKSENPYQDYAKVNIEATKDIASAALNNGVKRFIFISSVKVNGEATNTMPFNELNSPNPEDDYAKTKCEAENVLREIAAKSTMEMVIIRPPLIYGKGVKANFKNLIKLCELMIPLPFGAIHNKRNFVYIENLVDFIITCSMHPKATNQTFLVSDDEDVSTTTLIQTIRESLGMPNLIIPIPQSWLVFCLNLIGKRNLAKRLCGNLQVDISKAKNLLGWRPPYSFDEGIKITVSAYLNDKKTL